MPPPAKASVHLRFDADVLEWFSRLLKNPLTAPDSL